ncbi:hypothetical protein B0O80DRAFT_429235 [Mortierella sp. GBAus27b]|nr:hypothetical protein B0O80DRAFT_429235 [Mortierella sp. GBAus27b]
MLLNTRQNVPESTRPLKSAEEVCDGTRKVDKDGGRCSEARFSEADSVARLASSKPLELLSFGLSRSNRRASSLYLMVVQEGLKRAQTRFSHFLITHSHSSLQQKNQYPYDTPPIMSADTTTPPMQEFRCQSTDEVLEIATQLDSATGKHFVLWKDIQVGFENAKSIRNGVYFGTKECLEEKVQRIFFEGRSGGCCIDMEASRKLWEWSLPSLRTVALEGPPATMFFLAWLRGCPNLPCYRADCSTTCRGQSLAEQDSKTLSPIPVSKRRWEQHLYSHS